MLVFTNTCNIVIVIVIHKQNSVGLLLALGALGGGWHPREGKRLLLLRWDEETPVQELASAQWSPLVRQQQTATLGTGVGKPLVRQIQRLQTTNATLGTGVGKAAEVA